MKKSTSATVYNWLRALKIPVAASYLRHKLLSNTNYPSLLSITDTLDDLGIENAALVVNRSNMQEIPVPFLVYSAAEGGIFVKVDDISVFERRAPEYIKNWDGIIVVAKKPEVFINKENEQWLAKEKRTTTAVIFTAVLTTVFTGTALWLHFSWTLLGLALSSLAGLFISVMIVLHEMGYVNPITDKLCAAGKNTDCNAVLASKTGSFMKAFNWSDGGIIYFPVLLLTICLAAFSNITHQLVAGIGFLSACSLPVTFYSLYYQYRVIKKWCPLCLLTVAILWLQFLLVMPLLTVQNTDLVTISSLLVIALTGAFLSFTWFLLVKPWFNKVKELELVNYALTRFKNNHEVFGSLLKQQQQTDVHPFNGDLQLGNPNSGIQFMVACNPYCRPCATAHAVLHDLMACHDVGVTIRFTINAGMIHDKRTRAARYILQVISENKNNHQCSRQVIADWYRLMDLDQFAELYPLEKKEVIDELLHQHEKWSEASGIQYTPTLFINGYQMPPYYFINDLPGLVKGLSETLCLQPKVTALDTLTQADVSNSKF
jgi:uncharacterized membrane protein